MSKYIGSTAQRRLRSLLRQARLDAGLRQQDLATRLKESQSFVSKYESGERRLDLLELQQICNALGLSLGQFVHQFEGFTNAAGPKVSKAAKALLGKRQKR